MDKEPQNESMYFDLQQEIVAMVEQDKRVRQQEEYDPSVDQRNTARLKELIAQYGWPERSQVGPEAASGARILVQHADHDVEFQERVLALMTEAAERGEARLRDVAYLTDRIRVNSGRPQLYGTQFHEDEQGSLVPRPIEDPELLDERRKEFELEPFAEYEEIMQQHYGRTER